MHYTEELCILKQLIKNRKACFNNTNYCLNELKPLASLFWGNYLQLNCTLSVHRAPLSFILNSTNTTCHMAGSLHILKKVKTLYANLASSLKTDTFLLVTSTFNRNFIQTYFTCFSVIIIYQFCIAAKLTSFAFFKLPKIFLAYEFVSKNF